MPACPSIAHSSTSSLICSFVCHRLLVFAKHSMYTHLALCEKPSNNCPALDYVRWQNFIGRVYNATNIANQINNQWLTLRCLEVLNTTVHTVKYITSQHTQSKIFTSLWNQSWYFFCWPNLTFDMMKFSLVSMSGVTRLTMNRRDVLMLSSWRTPATRFVTLRRRWMPLRYHTIRATCSITVEEGLMAVRLNWINFK